LIRTAARISGVLFLDCYIVPPHRMVAHGSMSVYPSVRYPAREAETSVCMRTLSGTTAPLAFSTRYCAMDRQQVRVPRTTQDIRVQAAIRTVVPPITAGISCRLSNRRVVCRPPRTRPAVSGTRPNVRSGAAWAATLATRSGTQIG